MADISAIKLPNDTTYNIKAGVIPYGEVDSTSTSTVYTATISGINLLTDGTIVLLKNGIITSEANFTININGLGAKPVYSNMATGNSITPTDPTRDTTIFNINYTMLLIYSEDIVDDGGWICYRGYDANTNTIGYQLRTNAALRPAADKGYKYRFWFTSADGTEWVPANTSTSTNATATRTPNTRPIDPFGEIIYYGTNGTTNAGVNLSATNCWQQYTVNLGYSFNTTGAALTLTNPAPVYVKCEPQINGSAIIKGYTQALPSSDDGFIYIFLGMAYSATSVELFPTHPVYWHDGNGVRIWTGKKIPTKTSDLTNDSGFITSYTDNKVSQNVSTSNTPQPILFRNNVGTSASASTEGVRYSTAVTVTPSTGAISATTFNGYTLAAASQKSVDTSISASSTSTNLPTSAAVASFVEGKGYLTSYTETDPVFSASAAAGITSSNISTWNGKQDTLISGTNIKTINNNSLLGNGDLVLSIPTAISELTNDSGFIDTAGAGLTITDTTIGHTNSILPTTGGGTSVYPIAIDETGHIRSYGSAVTIPSKTSDLTNDSGFITSYTETDPVFVASAAYGIASSDITNWNGKQAALVSGTNIKTINGDSILGSGDLTVTGGTQVQLVRWS